ncbi:MAG: hypothetical protein RL549_384 [Verrucomicrobiota bacterium]|jgi:hypothetical protein
MEAEVNPFFSGACFFTIPQVWGWRLTAWERARIRWVAQDWLLGHGGFSRFHPKTAYKSYSNATHIMIQHIVLRSDQLKK